MHLNNYQSKAVSTAVYPSDMKVTYPVLGLTGETGEFIEKLLLMGVCVGKISELVKKLHRDDNGQPSDKRLQLLKKELGDQMWYIANIANDLGLSLEEICQHNIEKLFSRKERGVLKGDGDER